MAELVNGKLTRRGLLKAGTAMTALPFLGIAAPGVLAQGARNRRPRCSTSRPTPMSPRPSRKASSCSTATRTRPAPPAIMEGFSKDFPKIKTSYVRAQTGALYNKILSERSAGRFDVDVHPAVRSRAGGRFPEKGRLRALRRRRNRRLQEGPPERAGRLVFLDRRRPSPGSPTTRRRSRPRTRRRPGRTSSIRAGRARSAARSPRPACSSCSGICCARCTATDFWKEFAKQQPHAFDSRVQLFDRLAKGDDDDHRDRRISGLHSVQGAAAPRSSSSRRPTGWWRRRWSSARSTRRRIRKRPSCSSTGRCRSADRTGTRPTRTSITARCARTRRRCRPG